MTARRYLQWVNALCCERVETRCAGAALQMGLTPLTRKTVCMLDRRIKRWKHSASNSVARATQNLVPRVWSSHFPGSTPLPRESAGAQTHLSSDCVTALGHLQLIPRRCTRCCADLGHLCLSPPTVSDKRNINQEAHRPITGHCSCHLKLRSSVVPRFNRGNDPTVTVLW